MSPLGTTLGKHFPQGLESAQGKVAHDSFKAERARIFALRGDRSERGARAVGAQDSLFY